MMSDYLDKLAVLERIELIAKVGNSGICTSRERQVAFDWIAELAEQVRKEIISNVKTKRPLSSGSELRSRANF
ncbi:MULTISPECIES: hypothetical protein [Photorhabdus]|uniref:Uncharacterized protein n=5 Tax=Photorhabdus TaxID=29487 RepID=A0ABX0B8J2_9GAMM|nr:MULTISPECIES: hypothetical protein [Photorhabdus]AKH63958.1 hypothetical protein VY86_12105 [Photorhabdus thracensis]MCC8374661.1 hypothetical protein [Photorhabdus bodei]MDB6374117.1 hypothetical protein [Photorhabdus bodei]NDL13616.1 hypothetical protein [Photorhabdus kayaii]NDL27176.1 hypothetical protein [Photorhabdus kayaii]